MNKSTHRHRRFFALLGALLSTAVGLTARAEDARPIDGITDNSFLIEEAYNQDPGVVQHIFTGVYSEDNDADPQRRSWAFGFTQEWPRCFRTGTNFLTPSRSLSPAREGTVRMESRISC